MIVDDRQPLTVGDRSESYGEMPSDSHAELRRRVTALVTEALARLTSPGARGAGAPGLTVLLSGPAEPDAAFVRAVTTLAAAGHPIAVAASRTFLQHHGAGWMARHLPCAGAAILDGDAPEPAQAAAGTSAAAVLSPGFGANTSAKLALGLEDSLPTRIVRAALAAGRPVLVARGACGAEGSAALRALGPRWHDAADLPRAVTEALAPHVNETPERLARQAPPAARRVFVTVEDVREAAAAGHRELRVGGGATVTDAAREEAATRGVALKEQS